MKTLTGRINRVRRDSALGMRHIETAIMSLIAVFLIPACSSDTASSNVTVRVFVDSNENAAWDEGDIPVPDVVVLLDEDLSTITNPEGRAVFQDVSGRRHTITLDKEAVDELATHSVLCDAPSQTVNLDGGTEILFCLRASGFLEVDVSEQGEGK
jgi:hypothetical protein